MELKTRHHCLSPVRREGGNGRVTVSRASHPAAPERPLEPQPGPWLQHSGHGQNPSVRPHAGLAGAPRDTQEGPGPPASPRGAAAATRTCWLSRPRLLLSGRRLTREKRSPAVGVNICPALEYAKGHAPRVERQTANARLEGLRREGSHREGSRPRSLRAAQVQDEYPERPGLRLNVVFLNQK